MSSLSNPGCGTCKSRKTNCDRTWGAAGCRRCTEDGLGCRRRIPIFRNNVKTIGAPNTEYTTHRGCITYNPSTRIPHNPGPNHSELADSTMSVGLLALPSSGSTSTVHWIIPSHQKDIGPSPPIPIHSTENSTPSTRKSTALNIQALAPAPPVEAVGSPHESAALARLAIGNRALAQPLVPTRSRSYITASKRRFGANPYSTSDFRLPMGPVIRRSGLYFDHEDPENIRTSLLDGLSLDREVESNTLPFLLHSTSTTDYDLTDYIVFQKHLMSGVFRARACEELTREVALEAMEASHELLCAMWRVGSLANVLSTMHLYAPIFRRACQESSHELVNFPRLLLTPNINLPCYALVDILQSFLTGRPMFFRYDLNFSLPQIEEVIKLDQGVGLRWLYGIPSQIILILARINTILEDHGSTIDEEQVRELGEDIGACASFLPSSINADPTLNMGRLMVQESWKLVAYVYLYMGLCGANSSDTRVIQVQKRFMRTLRGIKPLRHSDSFLIIPMTILGITTAAPAERDMILTRLRGVFECTKPGTLGHNLVTLLKDIWVRTRHRPAV
ncbi:hypothetical protein RSOLAG1IB_09965 [Rhizoctonia solani AG-1 IB]|uniref:Zn(2)-C6 fungal-type domain-containing protein n=1 Tax=Thanatephorus cucumeris (strain AG1-IB / isolate 7/3/14) TaxID=1108050 RepID=A0A0B7FYT9_THACB|nr:hypothetical protein RSOLAG1IB_09965 [Rhizoctonia solani AG-1 IB]